jgi:hypothetical protein
MANWIRKWRDHIAQSPAGVRVLALVHAWTVYTLPTLDLLEGEKVELEIRQAWYRSAFPTFIWHYSWVIGLIALVMLALVGYVEIRVWNSMLISWLTLLLPLALLLWAAVERLRYEQWRLIITNRRTILYIPDPEHWWRVETVRMGGTKRISVVDTNFSRNPWWGIFQTWTGARDLVFSTSGYAFKEGKAQVMGGLIMPDVMPEDVRKLEEKIF